MSRALLDTNIVLRHQNRDDLKHGAVVAHLEQLVTNEYELCIGGQVVFESWVVMTRPIAVNGWGLEPRAAGTEIARILGAYTLVPDPPDLLDIWLAICTDHQVRGKKAHDARHVALAIAAGIREVVTFDADFARFDGLTILSPPAQA